MATPFLTRGRLTAVLLTSAVWSGPAVSQEPLARRVVECASDAAAANVRLVRRTVEEGYNGRNPAIFDSAYHPDAVVWNNGVRLDDAPILEGFRLDMAGYDRQFSAWRIDVDDIFGTADRVAVRWTFHGRLRDSGRDVSQTGNWIGRIANGRIAEVWEATDEPGTPAPPQLTDAERAAVADTIRRQKAAVVDAFDSQDCEFEFPVSEDLVTVVDGRLIQAPRLGREELVATCRRLSEQRLSATDSIQDENVHVLGPNAAYVITRSIYTVRLRDGRTTIRPQVATGIWSRAADGWRLVHLHESWRDAEVQSTPPPEEGDTP